MTVVVSDNKTAITLTNVTTGDITIDNIKVGK